MIKTFSFPVKAGADYQTLMETAAEIGRDEGRDHDWTPNSLQEALFEIILFDSDSIVEPLSAQHAAQATHTLDVDIHILNGDTLEVHVRTAQEGIIELLEDGDVKNLQDCILAGLVSADSPVDYGFEIVDLVQSASAHEKMADMAGCPA